MPHAGASVSQTSGGRDQQAIVREAAIFGYPAARIVIVGCNPLARSEQTRPVQAERTRALARRGLGPRTREVDLDEVAPTRRTGLQACLEKCRISEMPSAIDPAHNLRGARDDTPMRDPHLGERPESNRSRGSDWLVKDDID